jgi:hypothetical protein
MKLRWLIPVVFLLPLRSFASGLAVGARVATVTINPTEVTLLHLRPEFESTIRMPEEVTSVILGSPGSFKAEHNEGEPEYVYVKPITKVPAQSNLLIATKSGQHVTLELISDGVANSATQPVDFLIEYRFSRSFLISSDFPPPAIANGSRGVLTQFEEPTQSGVSDVLPLPTIESADSDAKGRSASVSTLGFATRADAKGTDGIGKSKLVLLGGGLAIAVLFLSSPQLLESLRRRRCPASRRLNWQNKTGPNSPRAA